MALDWRRIRCHSGCLFLQMDSLLQNWLSHTTLGKRLLFLFDSELVCVELQLIIILIINLLIVLSNYRLFGL